MLEWKEVPGFEFFEVTSCGRVRTKDRVTRLTRNGKEHSARFRGKEVFPCVERNGYYQIAHMSNGERKKYLVHRLVGFAYVPGYRDGYTINHMNGDKLDNRALNLEWVTLSRNTQHQWESGLVDLRGENQPNSKLTSRQVVYIRRLLRAGVSAHALAIPHYGGDGQGLHFVADRRIRIALPFSCHFRYPPHPQSHESRESLR